MDSVFFDNVKAEKAKAMRRYNRLRSLAEAFRFFELLLALLFLAWTFERVPFVVKISGEFILKLGGVVASPIFVFLVCNIIIVTLIAKSGIFTAVSNNDSKIYEEITKIAENRSKSESQEEIVYQDKEMVSESNTNTLTSEKMDPEMDSDPERDNPRVYTKSKSEKLPIRKTEEVTKALRRSDTEKSRKIENINDEMFPEDKLSNEEFQRTIEDFIAKQLRFRREESLSIVLQC